MREREFARLVAMKICDLQRVSTSDANNISGSFSDEKFLATLRYLKPVKAPGPDAIFSELIIHVKNSLKS